MAYCRLCIAKEIAKRNTQNAIRKVGVGWAPPTAFAAHGGCSVRKRTLHLSHRTNSTNQTLVMLSEAKHPRMRTSTECLGKQTGPLCFGDSTGDAQPEILHYAIAPFRMTSVKWEKKLKGQTSLPGKEDHGH